MAATHGRAAQPALKLHTGTTLITSHTSTILITSSPPHHLLPPPLSPQLPGCLNNLSLLMLSKERSCLFCGGPPRQRHP